MTVFLLASDLHQLIDLKVRILIVVGNVNLGDLATINDGLNWSSHIEEYSVADLNIC